jgi:RNA polymerase subunit RPABC4/transcription elongation factor Spt4
MGKLSFLGTIHWNEVTMKLQNSKLCVNCESIYEETTSCPYCQSEVFVWLFQALGTTLDPDIEEMDNHSLSKQEPPASRAHVFQKNSLTSAFARRITGGRSFGELGMALGSASREMIRVLTFGMVQAYK